MLKYFVVPLVFFSISFSFIYDSHIGDDEKTEVDYMQHPALRGFTDTPKEGRLRAEYTWFPASSISNTYNSTGEVQALLDTQEFKSSAFTLKMDYFGYKKSGIALRVAGVKTDYLDESLDDISLSVAGATVYWIWGDKFTFPVYRIKTEIGLAGANLSSAIAIDYYITDSQMLSATIGLNEFSAMANANNDSTIFSYAPVSLNTKFIHNFSENIAVSGMYRSTLYSGAPDGLDINISSLQIAAGLQLTRLEYGYYDFNLGLKPAMEFPLSGKNHSKLNIFSLGFVLDFI
jgi:hypothetical protein